VRLAGRGRSARSERGVGLGGASRLESGFALREQFECERIEREIERELGRRVDLQWRGIQHGFVEFDGEQQ
jgi:hypothetical protein